MLFNAIVLPHHDYCSQVWTNASKHILKDLINYRQELFKSSFITQPLTLSDVVLLNLAYNSLLKEQTEISFYIQSEEQQLCHCSKNDLSLAV